MFFPFDPVWKFGNAMDAKLRFVSGIIKGEVDIRLQKEMRCTF